jgi:hypothetical protein
MKKQNFYNLKLKRGEKEMEENFDKYAATNGNK